MTPMRMPTSIASRLLLALALLCAWPLAAAQERLPQEHVKAAYLINFVRYAEWPAGALAPDRYRVAVLRDRGVAAAAHEIAAAAGPVDGRTIEVLSLDYEVASPRGRRRLREDLRDVDALYVGTGEAPRVFQILADAIGEPVLTVSDIDGFAAAGGMLGLALDRRHVVFDANPSAIQAAGLSVSAKVLTLARYVVGGRR